MSVTLGTASDLVYDILREESDASAYPLTLVYTFLNSAQDDFCAGLLVDPTTGKMLQKGALPYLASNKYYSTIQSTYLTADATVGGTTLTVSDTTNFSSTGVLYIAGDIITYTGKSSTTFTGCSGVEYAHQSGSQVSALYTLPTDYASPIEVRYANSMKLEGVAYDQVFGDLYDKRMGTYNLLYTGATLTTNNTLGGRPFYSIIDNTYLILWNIENTGSLVHLRYEKTSTTMTSSSDTFTISDDNTVKMFCVYYAAAQLLAQRGEETRAQALFSFALAEAKKSYRKYNNQTLEKQSGTRYKIDKAGRLVI